LTVACAGVIGLSLLGLILTGEVTDTAAHHTPAMVLSSSLFLAAVLMVLAVATVVLAVRPQYDPLRLPEKRLSRYVYSGEILIVLMAVHLRLSLPWLRTGVFLPLLPIVGFWLRPTGNYATLWFLAGLFYGLLAVMRRSLAFALLALLAANGGLWVILHENQLAFLHYPQLWVVPMALSVLVAGQLNRDRLGRRQLLTLRYTALTVIYLASTADAFVGLGQEVWRPLVLIGLALAGVFLGMLLRVRAFLFLGTAFVALGVFTLVYHAATAGEWVWYAAGVALGIVIFTLFAIFEKRRADVVRMIERLREWE
jgi:hypothetical protein